MKWGLIDLIKNILVQELLFFFFFFEEITIKLGKHELTRKRHWKDIEE